MSSATAPDIQAEILKAWRLGTSPLRMFPSFIIAGAAKCGTSSLYDLLMSHPDLHRAARKEPTNFIHYPGSALRSRMQMPFRFVGGACGEASVEYFTHPEAAESIKAVVPKVRLIFVLREPVSRAWSDYQMYVKAGRNLGAFGDLVSREIRWLSDPELEPLVQAAEVRAINPVRFVSTGMYVKHLRRWFGQFERNQMTFVFSDDLKQQPVETCHRLFDFLGVSKHDVPSLPPAREGGYESSPPESAVEELSAFYRSANADLSEMIGIPVPWR